MRRRVGEDVVMGLDLSLTGSAVAVLPGNWDATNPWAGVTFHRFTEEGKLAGLCRQAAIVRGIWQLAVRTGVKRAYVEQYAFSYVANSITVIAEMVGSVKLELWTSLGIEVVPVVASSARKTLLGPLPKMSRKEVKAHLKHAFAEMGAPELDEDQRDAFVIANRGRHDLGLPCLSCG